MAVGVHVVMFCDQFENRMFFLRLFDVLNGNEGVESCCWKARSASSKEERHGAQGEAAEVFDEAKSMTSGSN